MNATLHKDAINELLQESQKFDARFIDNITLTSWHKAATIGRWNFDQALEAINIHYATSTERLMPGHVTAIIKTLTPTQPSMNELRSNGTVSDRPALAATANQAYQELQANTRKDALATQSIADALTWFRKTCQYDSADEPQFTEHIRAGFTKYAAARKVWPWHVPGGGKQERPTESESMRKAGEMAGGGRCPECRGERRSGEHSAANRF